MIILHVTYHLLKNNGKEYVDALEASGIPGLCREEDGNIRYDYFYSVASEDQVLLVEVWRDKEALERHKETEHFQKLGQYKDQFVKETDIVRFSAEEYR